MKYWLYRKFWEITHKFNWHHMPVSGPLEDGRSQAWCQWCGLRDYVFDFDRVRGELNAEVLLCQKK